MEVKERKENEGFMVEEVEGGEVKVEERRDGRRVKLLKEEGGERGAEVKKGMSEMGQERVEVRRLGWGGWSRKKMGVINGMGSWLCGIWNLRFTEFTVSLLTWERYP